MEEKKKKVIDMLKLTVLKNVLKSIRMSYLVECGRGL